MIPTAIPELNKEQTEQINKDMKSATTKKTLDYWRTAIKEAQKIKRKI